MERARHLRLVREDKPESKRLVLNFYCTNKKEGELIRYLSDLLSDVVGPYSIVKEVDGPG